MARLPIPRTVAEMTPEWLTAALPPEVLNGAQVTDVETEALGLGAGFTGALSRVHLQTNPPNALSTLVAKQATAHTATRELMKDFGGYEKEVRFYKELARRVSLPTPTCYYADYDEQTGSFILLLEDLAPAAVGDQVQGASLEVAEQIVDALAEFHAAWWNSEELVGERWLLPPEGSAEKFLRLFDDGMPALKELWGSRYPDLTDLVTRTRSLLPDLFRLLESGEDLPRPYTVVHGDMRLDNLFFPTPEGGRFAVVDWQGVALSPPVNDLAYWLVLSLPVDTRRAHEERLLRRYHRGLQRHGVADYSLRAVRRAYRDTAVILLGGAPVLFENLDMSSERGQALIDAIGVRVDAAMRDLNAARAVRLLPWFLRALRAQRALSHLWRGAWRRVRR